MTEPRKTGRKPFSPSAHLRMQVETLAAYGVPEDDICPMIVNPTTDRPIDLKTLRKHFRKELDVGASRATAKVAESLFRQAVGAPAQYDGKGRLLRAERAPVLAATIFWMKTRAKLETIVGRQNKSVASSFTQADGFDHDV